MSAQNKPLIWAIIVAFSGTGLEVSGYTNLPLALFLWAVAGILFLWWLWHFLPENPFQRKFMGPLVLIFLGVVFIGAGGAWYYITAERAGSVSPLSIIDPGPHLIRTIIFTREGGDNKTFYRNVFLLGVRNTSPDQKTIRSVRLKFGLLDTPGNCKISGSEQTSVDLNPGDIAYFEIGYLDSLERSYVMKEFKQLPQKEFYGAYHNAGVGVFRIGTGDADSTLTFLLNNPSALEEPTVTIFQFSADDMPPLFFKIIVHKDAEHKVRLERQPYKTGDRIGARKVP